MPDDEDAAVAAFDTAWNATQAPASVPAPTRAQGRAGQSASPPPPVQPKAPIRFQPHNDRIAQP
ncbi:MAG: hypothetical protein JJT81_16635, partial [Rubellimicrobium sp.]|nr:hypothetical protein [Rubellimicrobium sp.]